MQFHRFIARTALLGTALCAMSLGVLRSATAQKNYIALGDSYAFGYLNAATPSSTGDQGYVKPFADFLGSINPGGRPTVSNLAIPGETTSSLLSGNISGFISQGASLVDAPLRNPNYNTNYPANSSGLANAQRTFAVNKINAIKGGGGTVDYISVQIGGNDILALYAQSNFLALTPVQQLAVINDRFAILNTNYQSLLTTLKANAPGAQIYLVGYADPFAGLGAANPLSGGNVANPLSTQLAVQSNTLIQGLATAFGAKYVDIYNPIKGNELVYTQVGTSDNGIPNFHPNAAGYNLIGQQLILATGAPEPGTVALLLCAGLPGTVLLVARRRK